MGLGQCADLRGGLGKKEGVVILRGGLIPQCTLCLGNSENTILENYWFYIIVFLFMILVFEVFDEICWNIFFVFSNSEGAIAIA